MQGASQPWLVRCDDGGFYVLKFQNNPAQGRILINEMLCSRLGQLIGLPVVTPAWVEVPLDLAAGDPRPAISLGGRPEPCATGFGFGSRYPGSPDQTLVVDFLPDPLLERVDNLAPLFLGGFVFDKWTCNCDGRQVIFFRPIDQAGKAYSGRLIDHGSCFDGDEWKFPDNPFRGLYPQRLVYDSVTCLESFEPFLSRLKNLHSPNIEECLTDIPTEWCSPDPGQLKSLVSTLYARAAGLPDLILDTQRYCLAFPNWV
jgi:hypothetical protein